MYNTSARVNASATTVTGSLLVLTTVSCEAPARSQLRATEPGVKGDGIGDGCNLTLKVARVCP